MVSPPLRDFAIPRGTDPAGLVHTHPPTTPGATAVNRCSANDKLFAQQEGYPIYLGAPNGDVRRFDPLIGSPSDDAVVGASDRLVGRWRNLGAASERASSIGIRENEHD